MSWGLWGVLTMGTTLPYQRQNLGEETSLSTFEGHGARTLAFLCGKGSK